MKLSAFATIRYQLDEGYGDIKFARQLRQVFYQIAAILASGCSDCKRNGVAISVFDLHGQTLFGAGR
jgi:hypothetical protein